MNPSLSGVQPALLPPALAVVVTLLGAYVALDIGRRVRGMDGAARNPWLMGAAGALCVGVWSAQVLSLHATLAGASAGFDPGLSIAAVLLGLAAAVAALRWWFAPQPTWPGVLGGAAMLATSALVIQVTLLISLGLAPRIRWHPGWLALAWAGAGMAFVIAACNYLSPGRQGMLAHQLRLAGTAAMATLAVIVAQASTLAAAGLPSLAVAADSSLVPTASMAAAATTGGIELLLLMLAGGVIERRIRDSLAPKPSATAPTGFRDPMTGLPTRQTFEGTMAQVLKQAETTHTEAVLLLLALDGFKHVNDAYGHPVGDATLKLVGRRLRELAPPHRVARLGGDEFLILLDGEDAVARAQALAAQALDAVAQPCTIEGREIGITASIGLAVYPQHGATQALITHASMASRAAKDSGGAAYSMFDPRAASNSREQAELVRDLRQALAHKQLELLYQPKVHAPSGQITGAEALLRWHHPVRGMISPTVFIPLAERSGLISSIGAWVIDEACRQAREWRDAGLRMRVAINLSAHQLHHAELPGQVAEALRRHQINPDLLTCEITESVAMEDTEATVRAFAELSAVGVHLSIDDFGSGYSSLAYLRKLPANELKIDRGFVLDIATSAEARKIVETVVQLAQALKLKVVAEGVENDEQYRILRGMGCDQLQGYLFAKPMPAQALALWAMDDVGPRSIQFRESLFKETGILAEA